MADSDSADSIIAVVQHFNGCSLVNRRDELAGLVARGVDDPDQIVQVTTNCGMFALGVFWRLGVNHSLLRTKYVSGMAIAWLRTIGKDLGALNEYADGQLPKRGALLHYSIPGRNDDHVEFLLSDIDDDGNADHGGGGRSENAISIGTGPVLKNNGRPLVEWFDPDILIPPT